MRFRLIGVPLIAILLVGCASKNSSQSVQGRADPFEGFNRTMFDVNYYYLDPYVVRPAAVFWRDYMPQPARNGLSNFFTNLAEPASMINHFAKGQFYEGFKSVNRFFLNTLFGMGGLIDVASMANSKLIKHEPQRFGSTLGHYHIGYGPYVVLPGYGSFTPRQDAGNYVDMLYPPLSWLTFLMSAGKEVVEGLETRAQLLNSEAIVRNSADPYVLVRDAYFQRNDFLAGGGKAESPVNPNAQAIEEDLKEIDGAN